MPANKIWRVVLLVCVTVILMQAAGCSAIDEMEKGHRTVANVEEGDRQMTLGNPAEARKWYDRAVALSPDDLATYMGDENNMGLVPSLADHGDYPDIEAYLTKAAANPKLSDSWQLYYALADSQSRLGEADLAKASYATELSLLNESGSKKGNDTISLSPDEFLVRKADAEWGAGLQKQATADYHRVMMTFPDVAPDAENNLAYAEADANVELPEALELSQTAVKLARANDSDNTEELGEFLDTLGWAQYRSGQFSNAAASLEESISDIPRESVSQYHLGCVYRALGRDDDAQIQFNRAASLAPSDPLIQAALHGKQPDAPTPSTAALPSKNASPLPSIAPTGAPVSHA